MQIQISIEKTEPLTGWAATGGTPVSFIGWWELLRAISDLVDAEGCHDDASRAVAADLTDQTRRNEELP